MAIQRISIDEFRTGARQHLLLDVRSPGEYGHAHMPGAISLPLFTDEERKVVGTAYKQESRETAIRHGLDFFGPKMRLMVEEVERLLAAQHPGDKTVYVYCWRGGMRSGAVAWLLDLYGFRVFTLAGGYKAYRNSVLQDFEHSYPFKVLGGYTGSGKTEVLAELAQQGATVIDLEGIACHKGSAFGAFRMPPAPTQEMFENQLSEALREAMPPAGEVIWIEDESQRIGNLNIPNTLWANMRSSPIIFLNIDFSKRLDYLVQEYGSCDRQKLVEATLRISKRLGPLETKQTVEFLELGDLHGAFTILLHYYDKRYFKGLHNREGLQTLLTNVDASSVDRHNALKLTKLQPA